jgi:hypothetical protein
MYLMRIANSSDHDFYCGALTALGTGFHSAIGTRRKMEVKK